MPLIKITAADKWFSMCVRERADWRCERCGKHHPPPTMALHCAHWHSRGNWSVRFDPHNACALCMGCHLLTAAKRDEEHRPLMYRLIGELQIDRLSYDKNRPANGIRKRAAEIAKHYRAEYRRIADLRAAGVVGRIEFANWQ